MYQYSFTDKDSKKIEEQATALDNLMKSFDEIDKKYSFNLDDQGKNFDQSLNLEKQTFTRPDESSVKKQAEDGLYDYKTTSLTKIENDYTTNKNAIDEKLNELSTSKNESKNNLKSAYENAKLDASNDAIKRGLARSSIIVNKLASYDKAMLDEFSKIENDWNEAYNKLSSEKTMLEVQKQNALDAFDIAYAVKLSEKINSINEKIDEKEREVIEYNNKVEQLEKEFELEKQKQIQDYNDKLNDKKLDILEYYGDYGTNQVELIKQTEKYDKALAYFMSIPKQEALSILENNDHFKASLKNYYNKLLTQIAAKEE